MENDSINKLTMRTGDPFADTGAWVIEILNKQYPDKNILELIEDVAKIYALDWDGKINAFFLNSTITHHARKGVEKVTATTEYYKSLIDESAPYIEGSCRLLGIKSKLFAAGRENNILCGSGTFINFHHAFQPGVMLSKEALIRIFFIPLGALSVGNLVAVINSNQPKIEKWFVQENFDENVKRLANKTSGGVLSSQFKNPANALFGFAKSCITRYAGQFSEDEPVEINLYHFSNFGTEPKISLYCFSAPLFKFYQKILHSRFLRDWEKFINCHYKNNASTFHEGDEQDYFLVTEKKETTKIEQDSFSTWYNPIGCNSKCRITRRFSTGFG